MRNPSNKKNLKAAVGLFFLAPLIGEFLLGNLPITWLWVLLSIAPLYGGGALLIRETVRRFKWGWPSILVLCLTFAIIEEAFVTQSLFNPNYVGLRLLDYGYIDSLGIGSWWTVFVLSIHTIWSTAVPIAIVENLASKNRKDPWLGPFGLGITTLLFLAGCVMLFIFQHQNSFMATSNQFLASGVIVFTLILLAIYLGNSSSKTNKFSAKHLPGIQMVGITAFLIGSAFMGLAMLVEIIPASVNVLGMILLISIGCALFWHWSKHIDWSDRHRFAIFGGLLMVYVWYGFVQVPSTGDTSVFIDTIGNIVFGTGAIILLYFASKK